MGCFRPNAREAISLEIKVAREAAAASVVHRIPVRTEKRERERERKNEEKGSER